jgi:hypothetical protein
MDPKELERLTRQYNRGDRVVAIRDVIYAESGREIAKGTAGTVVKVLESGVACVMWDMDAELLGFATSPESLEPEAHGRRRSS